MAEIKNSFLKSKMNKDLDDRLIPNGEYRDAQNISVGKSEADDIGALENVLGNALVSGTDLGNANLETIGYFADNNNSTIYLFLTDNTNHYIYKYFNSAYTKLVEGSFLNFSKNNVIIGINLVENLLFWTDNLNQPRKINVTKSLGYYTKENQISVAKYNPYEALTLLKTVEVTGATCPPSTTLTLAQSNTNIKKGMLVVATTNAGAVKIAASEYLYVSNISGTTVTLNVAPAAAVLATDTVKFLATTMTGKDITYDFNGGVDWPGDPDFLEDLFVRFSYRFKFDDKEYSLMAPFSQPAFIPQQKGYFLGSGGASPATPDDENAAYRSTILDFMQNGVQNVELIIPLPDVQNKLGDQAADTYKITEIDILYKESDGRAVKVLDTVETSNLTSLTLNTYTYDYQSRKPYKTLPERQTVRVYDKVPVRALAQEVSGNRVMYGNFQSQHTPPSSINYNVGANAKSTTAFNTWAEYPNHTLKQNRNYQVGFILSDKFGRQSSVILSSVDDGKTLGGTFFGGSTFYHPYRSSTQNLKEWWGDALKVVVNSPLLLGEESADLETGAPGLYAIPEGNGFNVSTVAQLNTAVTIPVLNVAGFEYEFTVTGSTTHVPTVGEYLRGENEDFVEIVEVDASSSPTYEVYTKTKINEFLYEKTLNNPDTKYAYTLPNPLGWYSYKIVVKQQEQDYYNCYFPGFLDGYPGQSSVTFPTNEDGKTGHVVLLNDNINKVPRDLSEVGPEQKQFRSSVRLYGRVNNTATDNVQFFPVNVSGTQVLPLAMTADTIADANDLKMATSEITTPTNFYQLDTNPLIARLATSNAGTTVLGITDPTMVPYLSIVETEPVESVLQLFYETSTTGLIADLNADVNTGFDGVAGLSALSYSQNENMAAAVDLTGVFYPQNNQGSNFANTDITSVNMVVNDGTNTTRTSEFSLITSGTGYKLQTANNQFVFRDDSSTKDVYTFSFTFTTNAGDTSTVTATGSLGNIAPEFTAGASLPDVTVAVDATAVVTRDGNNGSNSNNTDDLLYSITAGNSNNYFSINSTTGAITKLNTTPIGVYTLTLKIEDAVLNGVAQTGSLSVTKTQQITVGATAINAGAKSTCKINSSAGNPGVNYLSAPINTNPVVGVWYLSDSTLASSDLPVTPTAAQSGFSQGGGFKIGGALSQGTVVFQCIIQQSFTNNSSLGFSFTLSTVIWKVYYRDPNGTNTWNQIADINNFDQNPVAATGEIVNSTFDAADAVGKQASVAFAFDEVGEYAVCATELITQQALVNADAVCAWVNSNDLYYSDCVIENNANVQDSGTPKAYKYDVSATQTSYGCVATNSTHYYAPIPYAQYVDLFYSNVGLTSPVTPNASEFRTFNTDTVSTEPFDQIKVSAKFGTDGVKIAPTISEKFCNSGAYAVACQGGFSTCAQPIPGATGWV
jgi:hypothetical protein